MGRNIKRNPIEKRIRNIRKRNETEIISRGEKKGKRKNS